MTKHRKKLLLTLIIIFSFLIFNNFIFAQVFEPQIEIPGGEIGDQPIKPGEKIEITKKGTAFAEYLIAFYNWAIRAIVILGVVMIMVAGFQWMTSAGNAPKITQAKGRITSALIGIGIALGSYFILNFINPSLVTFRSLSLEEVKRVDKEACINGYWVYGINKSRCWEEFSNCEALYDIGIPGYIRDKSLKEEEITTIKAVLAVSADAGNCNIAGDSKGIVKTITMNQSTEWEAMIYKGCSSEYGDVPVEDWNSCGNACKLVLPTGVRAMMKAIFTNGNGYFSRIALELSEDGAGKAAGYWEDIEIFTNKSCGK